jgi:hypothetical protein
MYIIKHSSGLEDYSMVKPAFETGASYYYADTGELKISDLSGVSTDYTAMTVTISSSVYSISSLGTNQIIIPKLSFETYEPFTLTSEINDTLLITPFYSFGISGYAQTTISVLAGNNTVQFKFRGRFNLTSQTKISGNFPIVVKSAPLTPRGDYIEVI